MLALCALLTAALVYRYDLYEHEPVPLLGVAIALGALAMRLCGALEDRLLALLAAATPTAVAAVAAVTEELAKLLVVLFVSLAARREFDDPMDGIVYGSMAGLGAALEESVFYRGLPSAAHTFVPAAELVRLWAHIVLGGIAGFPLGFWRTRRLRCAVAAGGGLLVAVALHFGWDAMILSSVAGAPPGLGPTLAGIALMLASIGLYGRLVWLASERSRAQFAPRSPRRLWGWPFDRLVGGRALPPR